MRAKFKPLTGQVIVVTSASSGLGLAVAKQAAEAGAALLLTSTDEAGVRKLAADINAAGGRAHAVAADLADADVCARVARAAIARFGGFDTWIVAGGGDAARTNGVREAAAQLRAGARRGAIVHMSDGRLDGDVARGLKTYGHRINLTHIRLPRTLETFEGAADAALYAATHPVSAMALSGGGKLTAFTQAQRRRGVLLSVGVLAVAGVALWVTRKTVVSAARPYVGRGIRPLVVEAARRRPLQAARLAASHPRQAWKLLSALR